jgi:hypothetical protein
MNKLENRFKHVISTVTTLLKVKQPENNLLFTVKYLVSALYTNHINLICNAKHISLNYSKLNIYKKAKYFLTNDKKCLKEIHIKHITIN